MDNPSPKTRSRWLDALAAVTWRGWLALLGRWLLWTAAWAYGCGLWQMRHVHLGLEWLLEALIVLVTGRFPPYLWALSALSLAAAQLLRHMLRAGKIHA